MKKIMLAVFSVSVLVLFAGLGSKDTLRTKALQPPREIRLESKEQWIEIRGMKEADEKVVQEYLSRSSLYMNGIENPKEVIAYLKIVDSLNLFTRSDSELRELHYYPDRDDVIACYTCKTKGKYFVYFLYRETVESMIGSDSIPIYQADGGKIKIYTLPVKNPSDLEFHYLMDINGSVVKLIYKSGNENSLDITPEEFFKDLTSTTLNELSGIASETPDVPTPTITQQPEEEPTESPTTSTSPTEKKNVELKVTTKKITAKTTKITVTATKGATVSISAKGLKAKVKKVKMKGKKYTFKKLNFKNVKKGTKITCKATLKNCKPNKKQTLIK